jgi:hypothetical protein
MIRSDTRSLFTVKLNYMHVGAVYVYFLCMHRTGPILVTFLYLYMIIIMCSGMFSSLQESNYFTPQGEFRVDAGGSQTLLNCLMYKLAYFRFGEVQVLYATRVSQVFILWSFQCKVHVRAYMNIFSMLRNYKHC